jgi:4'-phosphopantetheinyl transferase
VWVRRPGDVPDGVGLLDEHERRTLVGFRSAATAHAYAAAHALARRAVAEVAGCGAAGVRIDRTCLECGAQHGRPTLPDLPLLHLSLSRADTLVAVAVTRAGPVGVDVEPVAATDFPGFPDVALHPAEWDHVEGRPLERTLRRARAWTRKEACLKALGVGLRTDPALVPTPPCEGSTDLDGTGSWVTVTDVPVPWPDVAVAVALAGRAAGMDVRVR